MLTLRGEGAQVAPRTPSVTQPSPTDQNENKAACDCIPNRNANPVPASRCDDSAREIPLSKGYFALVDADDFDRVNERRWYAHDLTSQGRTVYAKSWRHVENNYRGTVDHLHRFILGLDSSDPRIVHHINGNGLDNRRCNLVVLTQSEHVALHVRLKRSAGGQS